MNKSNVEFNKYKIEGDITIIYLEKRSGEIFECLIDTEDLAKVKNFGHRLYASYNPKKEYSYAKFTEYLGMINGKPKNRTINLHKFILGIKAGREVEVDHINHNTLDDRKENLRVTIHNKNLKNRNSKNSNNKSGYRNVCWVNKEHCWYVQLQVNGKNTRLGKFEKDKLKEAGQFAEEMRQKYYGEFAGNN